MKFFTQRHLWSFPLMLLMIFFSSCTKDEFSDVNMPQEDSFERSIRVENKPGSIIEGEYIVTFNQELAEFKQIESVRSEEEQISLLTSISTRILNDSRLSDRNLNEVFSNEDIHMAHLQNVSPETVAHLLEDERILDVEPNTVISMSLGNQLDPAFKSILVPADDDDDDEEDDDDKKENKNDKKENKDMRKSYKFAWIVDSGIDLDHSDLNVNTYYSKSFVKGESSPDDLFGHGTHVAGIIGATGKMEYFSGIAEGVVLVSIKVLDEHGEGTKKNLIKGLRHISKNVVPGDVINISLTSDYSRSVEKQITKLANKGAFVAIAAGNYSTDTKDYSPANINYQNVYVVGSVNNEDIFSSFSNYSTQSNYILAPGEKVFSTFKDNQYIRLDGTSMAAPYVAGALLIENGYLDLSQHIQTPAGYQPRARY